MKVNRWLAALLLASWTLNVALAVAYFSRSKYPPGGFFAPAAAPPRLQGEPLPPPLLPPEELRGELRELHQRRAELLRRLADQFAADTLDTAVVRAVNDSIEAVRAALQEQLVQQMTLMHGRFTPEQRRTMARWMRYEPGGKEHRGRQWKDRWRGHR